MSAKEMPSTGRRRLIGGIALGLLALRRPATAQSPGKVHRIGYLSTPTRASVERAHAAFLDKLRALGWSDGQNLAIEYRWAEGNVERLPLLAADLVARKVDLIVAPAASAAVAAHKATSSIPIVMIFPPDPVELGLVASLGHPGGNVTGTTYAPGSIMAKQLELLKEAVPGATGIAVLWNPADPGDTPQLKDLLETSARAMRIKLQHVGASNPSEFENAFAAMTRERSEALITSVSSTFTAHASALAASALKARLPTMCSYREMVKAGNLMAYGVNMTEFIGRAAGYVDKILRGAKPADLPVEQPTQFELVINGGTARALGLTIPMSLSLRAEVI
jgi:putative tryptophan/tyrosine transport system substrate-binding protein